MRNMFFLFSFLLFALDTSHAQSVYPVNSTFNSIRQNGVSSLEAGGDTIWISPALNFNVANSADWLLPTGIDSILNSDGRVFSLSKDGPRLAVGLGYSPTVNNESVPSAFGYYFSIDGGSSWTFSDFPLDGNPPENCNNDLPYDGSCDIEFVYGDSTYFRTRITVVQQSPPYSIATKNNISFSANWASGLLRSRDFGQNWERIILPPATAQSMTPDNSYTWTSSFQGTTIGRYDPRSDLNLLGFATFIDDNGQVWYGSASGINISTDAMTTSIDSISWRHITFNGQENGLLGNWIIDINQDPGTGKIWMTNWIIDSQNGEQFGIVSTEDGGLNFEQHLVGEKINDIGFKDGTIFAAGENGLFVSANDGRTWTKTPPIRSANTFLKESTEFFAVTSTTNRVWIGTSDGIASSDDLGVNWEITRVNFPLSGGNVFDPEAQSTDTFAYPNPFSPTLHELVRIKFEVQQEGSVTIRIYDFGMNLVREIVNDFFPIGEYETVWDGIDAKGRQVANAPYIYIVEMNDRTVNGKILVVE